MKRLCAVFLVLSLVFSTIPVVYATNNEQTWEINISSIELFDELHSVTTEIAYDGTVSYINHDDYPTEGFVFAVVKMSASKLDPSADALDISNLNLYAEEDNYSQMEDDSFLENHGYTTLGKYNGSLMTDTQGAACFEVPEELLNSDCLGWQLAAGQFISEGYSPDESTEIPIEPDLIERQTKTEAAILAQFDGQSDKSLKNALVVVNPYETAPLTALILFDTDEAVSVSVKVYGKTSDTDITYVIDKEDTHHEVPIFGLYGGYDNRVVVETSGGEQREFIIKTASLPNDLPTYTVDTIEDSQIDNSGLIYVLGIPHRHCIDKNGDIRWFSTLTDIAGMPEETTSNASYWTGIGTLSLGAPIAEVSFSGKILSSFSYFNMDQHHDAEILPDGNLMYFNGTQVRLLNTKDGTNTCWLELGNILDKDKGYVDYRGTPEDWAHLNTIEFSEGKIFLSLRNQSMLMKLDYATKNIEWVATPAIAKDNSGEYHALQDSITPAIVLPSEEDETFEWFWSQHDISILNDSDSNVDTDEFTLFDNGVYRGDPNTSEEEMYSRIVQYKVDTKTKTIKQVLE